MHGLGKIPERNATPASWRWQVDLGKNPDRKVNSCKRYPRGMPSSSSRAAQPVPRMSAAAPAGSVRPAPPLPARDVAAAAANAFRPLVRLLIAHGVLLPQFVEWLKRLYVEEADARFREHSIRQSDSRVSLLTGVHRKDVRRLRSPDAVAEAAMAESLPTAVLRRWTGDLRFMSRQGVARALPRRSAGRDGRAPRGPTFEDLVESVSKDIGPRAVLDELQRVGFVDIDERGRVVLLDWRQPTGSTRWALALEGLGRWGGDRVAVLVDNILARDVVQFSRTITAQRVTEAAARQVTAELERRTDKILASLNVEITQAEQAGVDDPAANRRMSFGVYAFHEPGGDEPGSAESVRDRSAPRRRPARRP